LLLLVDLLFAARIVSDDLDLEQLSPSRRLYLHANALSPILVVGLCLGSFRNIVAGVLAFQSICLVLLPAL
jgi:hypothetical protein